MSTRSFLIVLAALLFAGCGESEKSRLANPDTAYLPATGGSESNSAEPGSSYDPISYWAIAEVAAHRLGHEMQGLGAESVVLLEVEDFEDVEHFDEADAAGAWRRRGEDVVAEVAAVDGRSGDGLVAGQVFFGDQAAAGFHVGGDPFSNRAGVEGVRPLFGNDAQCSCEIGLNQAIAGVPLFTVGSCEDALQLDEVLGGRQHVVQGFRVVGVKNKALFGKHGRWHDEGFPGELTKFAVGHRQAADGSRHAGDTMPVGRVAFIEHCFVGGGGGGFAIVDDGRRTRGGVDEHETAAADVAGSWMRDGQGEGGGHGCVNRVAALLEDR